ncbi:hypothetical protein K1T71_009243 [Dendrolimus kikuchii]|uniref:Uncharacterized protein n=1 Tax=Dendrolimus kikuchii TaxID=765133 RepID=A0ACC1CVL0_9NEOP|nr:hypothetical protein K1T71_009243 [Dendrolimus kikuchii]
MAAVNLNPLFVYNDLTCAILEVMDDKKESVETKKQIEELKQWASKQTDFPKEIGDRIYLRFLHSCYYDLEKAKTALELFVTFRNDSPELLCNRDPQSPDIQKVLRIVNLAQYKISGDRNLWIWQLNDPGLEVYDYILDAKVFILGADTWLLQNDFLEDQFFQLNFHSPNSTTLYKFVNKDELPADFGGNLPKLDDLMKSEEAKIMSCRDRLIDVNLWRVDKKQVKDKSDISTGVGTFRSLAID